VGNLENQTKTNGGGKEEKELNGTLEKKAQPGKGPYGGGVKVVIRWNRSEKSVATEKELVSLPGIIGPQHWEVSGKQKT